jgi:hypothetical protein
VSSLAFRIASTKWIRQCRRRLRLAWPTNYALEERGNIKMDTLSPRCISSTDEGAHLCESTVAQGLCHLGAPRHTVSRLPTLHQAAAAVVLRAARPHHIKLSSRSSVLLVSIMSRSRSRCAALRSLPRCSFARAVSRSPTHLVPRDLALACDPWPAPELASSCDVECKCLLLLETATVPWICICCSHEAY